MKVLFIIYRDSKNPFAVGGDLYFCELAKGLSSLGHNVTIICSTYPGALEKENIDGVKIIRVKKSVFLSFDFFKEYLRQRENYDAVIEEAIGGQRLPFLSKFYVKEPIISVWHQKNQKIFFEQFSFPLAIILSFLERIQARLYRNEVIVTPSKGARAELLGLGFGYKKVKVVYDGVPTNLCSNPKPREQRKDVIIWLGKLRRYKRPDHILYALPSVIKNTNRNISLIIAGKASEFDYDYINDLKQQAKTLGVSDFVTFKININEKQKSELLSSAYLLCQPSPVEGFSIVVMEANCFGTPVVASTGVPKDVVIENFNGLVYQYGNIEPLSQALTKLFTDNSLWSSLSQNSIAWAKNFTWERSAQQLEAVIKELLNK